ncbi:Fic family protein [Cellulosimicrobium cellulans]|uniref:Fic family protein n=1 Tax=Cellulosimicrobium cellulans TaxID=1710 RepID=UPI0012FD4305|nr:Fic family protein [Cellulosimicrobium cellulans]
MRQQAQRANERIRSEAAALLEPYLRATRTELVAESNVMEHMQWTTAEVRETILRNRELLDGPTRTLVESVRSDPRVYEVLGLYRAHELAEDWTSIDRAPLASEVRSLHALILGAVRGSGEYKKFTNAISGTSHRTADPQDVARVVIEMCDWWRGGTDDPLLTATVVHAWLAHIHPFDDGNGRTARVLANLELARHSYPPLVLRPGADRGQYYDALAASDEGDILPLYELFVHVIRRQVRLMVRPNYVLDLIEDKFLASGDDRYRYWSDTLAGFTERMSASVDSYRAEFRVKSLLDDPRSFQLLCDRDPAGNGWYATIGLPGTDAEWLLWFGYKSAEMEALDGEGRTYPSIFVSRRDRRPDALHPYSQTFDRSLLDIPVPDEIGLLPMVAKPVGLRWEFRLEDYALADGAERLASALCAAL